MVFNAGNYIYTVNCHYDLGEDSGKDATVISFLWWGCIPLPQIILSLLLVCVEEAKIKIVQNSNILRVHFVKIEDMKRQVVPCESSFKGISFKWSNSTIGFTDPEVIIPITTMEDKNPWNSYGKLPLPHH